MVLPGCIAAKLQQQVNSAIRLRVPYAMTGANCASGNRATTITCITGACASYPRSSIWSCEMQRRGTDNVPALSLSGSEGGTPIPVCVVISEAYA
eukprot:2170572-Rhodomonas_salina.2